MKFCDKCVYAVNKKLKVESICCIKLIRSTNSGNWYNLCCRCILLHEYSWDYGKVVRKTTNEFCPHVYIKII